MISAGEFRNGITFEMDGKVMQVVEFQHVKPGKDIDAAARKVIEEAGYGPYFSHGYGHSVGLEIHESPSPNARNEEPMPENSVASAEPGIYLAGKFGVRIEDCIIFKADGHENLATSPKELIIV